jgi:alpha-tubulin suppressor-like RCC1 family protein/DNA-binding SARP family transcriptional activator
VAQETFRDARLRLRTFGGLSLTDQSDQPLPEALNLRRPLVLLALLAVSGQTGMSREKVCSLISPESDTEHGRNTLKQTVFRLRRASGEPEIISGATELRLNPAVISSDVGDFLDALKLGERRRAVELYAGPFLDGIALRDAREFSRWVEAERERLEHLAEHALRTLAERATHERNAREAARWWRRLAELRPADGLVAVRLMRALASLGEGSEALDHAHSHTAYMRSQLEQDPDPAVAELAEELKGAPNAAVSRSQATQAGIAVEAERTDPTTGSEQGSLGSGNGNHTDAIGKTIRSRPSGRKILVLATAMLVIVLGSVEALTEKTRKTRGNPAYLARIDGISSSSDGTCGVREGRIICWGRNDEGQLGNGTVRDARFAARAASRDGPQLNFIQVTTSGMHGCGLTASSIAYCWGQNSEGQLGTPSLPGSAVPVQVAGDARFRALAAGSYHTCGIALDHSIYCWGWNNYGQLGNPSVNGRASTPVRVSASLSFSSVSSNYLHTCALTLAGLAYCWGSNVEGQLGIGTSRISKVPSLVTDARSFSQIVTGSNHSCALDVSGEAFCWGYNAFGQLGNATLAKCGRVPYQVPCSPQPLPVRTSLRFTRLAAGQFHSCGLVATGEAHCWGRNDKGQLGDGTYADSFSPVAVLGGLRFVSLAGGVSHTCGVATDGGVYCWGANDRGQLGDGSSAPSAAPVPVLMGQ